jgi:hypothetical protein
MTLKYVISFCLLVCVSPLQLDEFRKILYWSYIPKGVDKIQVRVKSDKSKTFYVNTHARLSSWAMIGLRSGNRANCEVRRQAEKTLSIDH